MKTALITGVSSGLGRCLYSDLQQYYDKVFGIDQEYNDKECVIQGDVRKWETRQNCYELISKLSCDDGLDLLINNVGVNNICYLEDLKENDWENILSTNAKAIYLMTKHFLPKLKNSKGTVVNIVSNAAWMPMTASLAYNASKAAAAMMTKQLARELTKKYRITVFAICPNKLKDTGMSKYIEKRTLEVRGWTEEFSKQYQLNGLVTGEETDVKDISEVISFICSEKKRHKFLSGCVMEFGA